MSRRSLELLHEMQDIFGQKFGYAKNQSLIESEVLDEAPRRMPKSSPSDKGLLSKGKDLPTRSGKSGLTKSARKVMKAAASVVKKNPNNKAKQADDERKFQTVMKDIRSKTASLWGSKSKEKAKPEGGKSGASPAKGAKAAGSGAHNPFKHASKLGLGPDKANNAKTGCWKCKCGKIYDQGCDCTSTGSGKNCPESGTEKHITYHKDAHRAYNKKHHNCTNKAGKKIGCGES